MTRREDAKSSPTTREAEEAAEEEEEEEGKKKKKKNFILYIYLSGCTMTVIRELYGLVNFPRGKSHRSGVPLFVSPPAYGNPGPLGHRNRPGDSDGKSGMQLGETLGKKNLKLMQRQK